VGGMLRDVGFENLYPDVAKNEDAGTSRRPRVKLYSRTAISWKHERCSIIGWEARNCHSIKSMQMGSSVYFSRINP